MVRKIGMIIIIMISILILSKDIYATDYGVHPDYTYYITGSSTFGEYDFYYGSAQNKATKDFNGLIVMKYHENDTLYRTIMIDEGYSESVSFVGFFEDGSFGVAIVKFSFNYSIMEFELYSTEILKYDVFGNYVDRIIYHQAFKAFNNHGYLMVLSNDDTYQTDIVINSQLEIIEINPTIEANGNFTYQFQGKCKINGEYQDKIELTTPGNYEIIIEKFRYSYVMNLTLKSDVEGVENNGVYIGKTAVHANGLLFLNEEPYVSGTDILEIGNHRIRIEGIGDYVEEYQFIIDPIISGVEANKEYSTGVYINVPNSTLYLNKEIYENNSLVARPGRYELTIIGVNEYRKTLNFTIYPSVINLTNNGVYDFGYRLNFIGDGRLNGQIVEPGLELKAGIYHFELWFDEGVYAQYDFEILSLIEENNHETIKIPFLEIVLGVFSLVGLFLVFRKK